MQEHQPQYLRTPGFSSAFAVYLQAKREIMPSVRVHNPAYIQVGGCPSLYFFSSSPPVRVLHTCVLCKRGNLEPILYSVLFGVEICSTHPFAQTREDGARLGGNCARKTARKGGQPPKEDSNPRRAEQRSHATRQPLRVE